MKEKLKGMSDSQWELASDISKFTGAKYCIPIQTCTDAIMTSLQVLYQQIILEKNFLYKVKVKIPVSSYCSIRTVATNFRDQINSYNKCKVEITKQFYQYAEKGTFNFIMDDFLVVDSAHRLTKNMFNEVIKENKRFDKEVKCICLSFGWKKPFTSEGLRGGAILTNDKEFAELCWWFLNDGRTHGTKSSPKIINNRIWGIHANLTPQLCELIVPKFKQFMSSFPNGKFKRIDVKKEYPYIPPYYD